ncbi:MAG: hypothetical protein ACFFKA_09555, partial [Candidatus Thorarchaeota archaeon]
MDISKDILKYVSMGVLSHRNFEKLLDLKNERVLKIIKKFVDLCSPNKLTVISDSKEDIAYVRKMAIKNKEETELALKGHTVHYDGFFTMANHDQARDKNNTQVLIPKTELGKYPWINTKEREEGLNE